MSVGVSWSWAEHNLVMSAVSSRLRCGACPAPRPRARPFSTPRCGSWRSADPARCASATWRRPPSKSTMGVYTHFGSKQGLLEQLYLHGFRRLEDRLNSVPSDGSRPAGAAGVRPGLPRVRARQRSALRADVRARHPGLRPLRRQPDGRTHDLRDARGPASPTGGPTSPTPRPTRTSSGRRCTAWSPSS